MDTSFHLASIPFTHGDTANLVQTKVLCQIVFPVECGNQETKPVTKCDRFFQNQFSDGWALM
jgi:hypothetical protein